jgi:hypothetical protein
MRMGLHVNDSLGFPEAVTFCANVKPAMMLWLAPSKQVLQDCRRVSPNTKHVLRPYWANQTMGSEWDAFIRHTMDRVAEFGTLIDWYIGWNEVGCQDHAFLRTFCNAEISRAQKLNAAGVGAALGGFSTGAFDSASKAYDAVKPMLQFLHQTGPKNVWHSHEYAGPYMQYMCRTPDGMNQWSRGTKAGEPNWTYAKGPDGRTRALGWARWTEDAKAGVGFTGASAKGIWEPTLDGWLTLRYRMLRKRLVADGLAGVYMILTETGIDDTNPRPGGANMRGWRDYEGSEWSRIPGIGDYANQQRWYGYQLSHDRYVLGWCDFGFGTRDPAWNSFDLLQAPSMRERVAAEQLALPVGHIGDDPIPPPDPIPVPPPTNGVQPRIMAVTGDGYTALARRALMREPKAAEVAVMRTANGSAAIKAGAWYLSPFHKAVKV